MLKYALYLGCTIQAEQFGYEASVREVLPRLGVELVDMPNTSCCGYPAFSSVSSQGWYYLSARNMAIAEKMGLDMLPLCNGCYQSFVETKHVLSENSNMMNLIGAKLEKENLEYRGTVKLTHIIELLYDIIGTRKIGSIVVNPLENLTLASHPGCHAIRPSSLEMPDDAEHPRKLDYLVEALGADSMDYPEKTDCCGSMLATAKGQTTLTIAAEKLRSISELGIDGLVTTCPFCFQMYDGRQSEINDIIDFIFETDEGEIEVPVFYYTQLLGLAMGIEPVKLGLDLNKSPIDGILGRI